MSDEVKKAQEEAQRLAKELGIYEMICNIVTNGANHNETAEGKWESCFIKYRVKEKKSTTLADMVVASFVDMSSGDDIVTSLSMPNGVILYRSYEAPMGGQKVSDFRYGSWVEKLKAYSEQITADKKRAEAEKAAQERQVKLAPFSAISDEEFEKMMNQTAQ